MATLYEKYRAEINKWDWDGIIRDAQNNVQASEDFMDEGESYGSTYIGSVLSLSPSGKYYTPFANNNVDPCPVCHGKTRVSNKHGNQARYDELKHSVSVERMGAVDMYGPWANGQWPAGTIKIIEDLEKLEKYFQPEVECHRCGGLGSYEAYQDQEFWQALEDVARKHGGWIEQGEGDPLDTYFCISIENPEEESEIGEEEAESE